MILDTYKPATLRWHHRYSLDGKFDDHSHHLLLGLWSVCSTGPKPISEMPAWIVRRAFLFYAATISSRLTGRELTHWSMSETRHARLFVPSKNPGGKACCSTRIFNCGQLPTNPVLQIGEPVDHRLTALTPSPTPLRLMCLLGAHVDSLQRSASYGYAMEGG